MSNTKKFLFATYFSHLFKRDWKEERFTYLLIEKRYRETDMGGWLETSRGVHVYYEFPDKASLQEHIQNEIAPNARKDWAVYKRATTLEAKV
jgi:hypothetical protein